MKLMKNCELAEFGLEDRAAPRVPRSCGSLENSAGRSGRSDPPVPARREEGEYVGTVRFKRGELVEAWHKTGGWHKATIHELLGDGSVKVTWADDDPTDRIKKRKKIRPVRVD